jgi:hypothetical protein
VERNGGSAAGVARRPLDERICEGVVFALALWTVSAHLVVALGGNLLWVLLVFPAASGFAAFLWRRARADGALDDPGTADPGPESAEGPAPFAWAGVAIAAVAAGLWVFTGDALLVWAAGGAGLVLGLRAIVREPPSSSTAANAPAWAVPALSAACAALALVVQRPLPEDVFFVNLAIGAIDRMDLPLLSVETLHGRDDLPLFAAYALHSFELLVGAFAWISGIAPLRVFHHVAAPAAAALVPMAHAALLRRLLPGGWLAAAVVTLVVLASASASEHAFESFSFARLFSGQAVFLSVLLPLVYVYALDFAQRPGARAWLRLLVVQVAAVGCTTHAAWAAPLAAAAALACGVTLDRDGMRRLLRGASASAYALVAGFVVWLRIDASGPMLEERHAAGVMLAEALNGTFGSSALPAIVLFAAFGAWALCRGRARRFAVVAPLVAFATLLLPWADAAVRQLATGADYRRALWALPIPILLTLVLCAPRRLPALRARSSVGAALCIALALTFAFLVPLRDAHVAARLEAPADADLDRWARALNELAPDRRVVAPVDVGLRVPTARRHAYPLMVGGFLEPMRATLGEIAYRDRYVMTHYAGGELRHPQAEAIFGRGLELYDVQAVCLRVSEHVGTARALLKRAGYERRVQGSSFEIWARS